MTSSPRSTRAPEDPAATVIPPSAASFRAASDASSGSSDVIAHRCEHSVSRRRSRASRNRRGSRSCFRTGARTCTVYTVDAMVGCLGDGVFVGLGSSVIGIQPHRGAVNHCDHYRHRPCPRRIARRPNSLDISVDGKASPRKVKAELGYLVEQDVVTVTPEHRKVEDATQDVVTVTLEHQKVRMRVVQPSLCPQTRAVWPLRP